MKDVSSRNLQDLITFIYCGKVNINADDLNEFLKTAKALKIKGLDDDEITHSQPIPLTSSGHGRSQPKRAKHQSKIQPVAHHDNMQTTDSNDFDESAVSDEINEWNMQQEQSGNEYGDDGYMDDGNSSEMNESTHDQGGYWHDNKTELANGINDGMGMNANDSTAKRAAPSNAGS